VSALFGYGFGLEPGRPVVDEYGIGYGVRSGYTWSGTPLYLGATVLRYDGGVSDTEDVDIFTLDLELGYEFGAGPLLLRPYLGLGAPLGISNLTQSSEPGQRAGSGISLQAVPGLLASYQLGPLSVGAEARWALVLDWKNALSLLGSAGVAF
jgi:hypothetical protein